MIKKMLFIVFALSCFFTNNAFAEASAKDIIRKCSFLKDAKDVTSDADIGRYLDKENQCLKAEILKLVDINITDRNYNTKIRNNLKASETSTYEFFATASNFNKDCKLSATMFDCGTSARYVIPEAKWQEVLKLYLDFIVKLNNNLI